MSTKSLADSHLRLAGWLSILSAIITLPLFAVAIIAASDPSGTNALHLVSTLLLIFHTGIYCYVYLTFRDYLHKHFSFHGVDMLINGIVGISILAALLHVLAFVASEARDVVAVVTLLLVIPLGIISIKFGLALFSLKDSLFGLKNAYSYLVITMGVFLASVILILPGLFLGILVDMVLGIMLLRAATKK